jgi:hypothetical protein
MSGSCLTPSKRRTVPVRLIDVPLEQRLSGARLAVKWAADPDEAMDILRIALFPRADLVAWVKP